MQLRHLGRESTAHDTVPKQCIQSAISRKDLFVGDLFAQAVPSNDRTAVPRQSRQQAARIIAIEATGHPICDFAKVQKSSKSVTNSVRACTTDASCVLAMNSSSGKRISELVEPPEVLMKLGECQPPEMLMKLGECQPPEKLMNLAQVQCRSQRHQRHD